MEDAIKELNLAITLRANEASILYNAACTFKKPWPWQQKILAKFANSETRNRAGRLCVYRKSLAKQIKARGGPGLCLVQGPKSGAREWYATFGWVLRSVIG